MDASLHSEDLLKMSLCSKFCDSIPFEYFTIEVNVTMEPKITIQSSVKYRTWPDMSRCFHDIFPWYIYDACVTTLSLRFLRNWIERIGE